MKNKIFTFKYGCILVIISCIVFEFLDFVYNPAQFGEYVHDDMGLTIDELIQKHGYQVENHTIETEDGYILQMHRLYSSKSVPSQQNPKVVLLMHGVMHSSLSWLTGGSRNSLAYHYADQDYDVWLGNVRGNIFSRRHKFLHPDEHSREFFNFTWHEFGVHDVPAQVDYVLEKTGHKRLIYVGHSQGFLSVLVTLSEKPQYNEKIKVLIGLAPAVYLNHAQSPFIRTISYFQGLFEWAFDYFELHEVPSSYTPRESFLTNFGHRYCHDDRWLGQAFCYFCYSIAGGFHDKQMNRTLLPLIFSHAFNGASWKQVFHYTQVKNSGILRRFDYGNDKNIIHYGQETPPEYNFGNMKVPTGIYYSGNDWAASEMDVKRLIKTLPNVVHSSIPDPEFAHFDFMMGTNVTDFFNQVTNLTALYLHDHDHGHQHHPHHRAQPQQQP